MKKLLLFVFLTILLILVPGIIFATCPGTPSDCYTVVSCTQRETGTCRQSIDCEDHSVQATVAASLDGDGVYIPAGNCTWITPDPNGNGEGLEVKVAITLIGAGLGISGTVITNGITGTYPQLVWYRPSTTPNSGKFRMSGFRFIGGESVSDDGGFQCRSKGSTASDLVTNVRIDHNYFGGFGTGLSSGRAILIGDMCFGVADNNIFVNNVKTIDFEDLWGTETIPWGLSWTLGDSNVFYFEENTITNTGTYSVTSGGQGGGYVLRHNIYNLPGGLWPVLDVHGNFNPKTNNSGTVRTEVYRNIFNFSDANGVSIDIRGGTALWANNSFSGINLGSIRLREEHCHGTMNNVTCEWCCTDDISCIGCVASDWPGDTSSNCAQQVTGAYFWGNTNASGVINPYTEDITSGNPYYTSSSCIVLNRDYFLPTAGLQANLPGTCIDNTYYGTTDTDKIYKCHPANTWTVFYTPYQYPHPLRFQVTHTGGSLSGGKIQ